MAGIRVISGVAKGRRLKMVPGDGTRPIMDRVKQALFNILGDDVVEARVLDLFAGTGSVGIEALSRGAAYAEFVEADRGAVEVIRDNLTQTRLSENSRVIRGDVFAHLRRAPAAGFDYVHVAPPQYKGIWIEALSALDEQPGWVNPDGWVCAQIDPTEYKPLELAHLALVEERKYGSTLLVFYERTV
ncbi:MAG: 16S rRNA (guanine(966)-N(2))-methyltransferase RsmD [Anaerolineales bacterium]|nr:16S rRNA (guanine(966)-N(2))-methyltransferase RsmD [Anaerolineales bacterium]